MALEQSFDQNHSLLHRVSGPPEAPVLVYLPGIHGDWTPMGRLGPLLSERFRLVELAYPRAPEWTLEDYASGLKDVFDRLNIDSAHLLAESFGSLVGWSFTLRHPGRVRTILIAGGFCSTPGRLRVGFARHLLRLTPPRLFERSIDFYLGCVIRSRVPEGELRREDFFPASRTRRGWQALQSRLAIIRQTDVRPHLGRLRVPILYLGGTRDWVVPVRREIKLLRRRLPENCFFRSQLLPGAPHAILPARAQAVTGIITEWVEEHQRQPEPQEHSPLKPRAKPL